MAGPSHSLQTSYTHRVEGPASYWHAALGGFAVCRFEARASVLLNLFVENTTMDDSACAAPAHAAAPMAAGEAVSPCLWAEEELKEESLVKEWIDPAYLRVVQLVSSPTRPLLHVEGLRILAHLCRRAVQRPLPSKTVTPVAECEFAGIAALCRGEEEERYGKWPYSRETTLKWFVLLEALTVIRRFRRKGQTVIQIPLGPREPLNQAQLLGNLDDYASKYTNSKTAELLRRTKADIERYGVPTCDLEPGDVLDQQALQAVQRQLVEKLQESGLSRATSRKVALWLTGGPLAQIAKDYLHAVRTATTTPSKAIPLPLGDPALAGGTREQRPAAQQGDFAAPSTAGSGRFSDNEGHKDTALERAAGERAELLACSGTGEKNVARGADRRLGAGQGDSFDQQCPDRGRQDFAQGDSLAQEHAQSEAWHAMSVSRSRLPVHQGDSEQLEMREEVVAHPSKDVLSRHNRLACERLAVQQGDSLPAESPAATTIATGIALLAPQDDGAVVVSNSNSVSLSKASPTRDKLEFDTAAQRHETPQSPASPADRRVEALYLWTQLYSEEQRTASGGKQLIGGLINKLNERADLVRLSMVNVLMQRFFPDRHGPPTGCGARWFYRSYARYLSGQLAPSPEITSWAESAYSYEQIERALRAEHAYQQADVLTRPHRPLASCVVEHRLLEVVLGGTVVEGRQEHQATEEAGSSAAARHEQAEQRHEEHEVSAPADGVDNTAEALASSTTLHEYSPRDAAHTSQHQNEGYRQKAVVVKDPQAGWTSLEGVLWWRDQIARTSLSTSCCVEVLPTEYGRYVLVGTPHDDEAAAWLWSRGALRDARRRRDACCSMRRRAREQVSTMQT